MAINVITELDLEDVPYTLHKVLPSKSTVQIKLSQYWEENSSLDFLYIHKVHQITINGKVHFNHWLLSSNTNRYYIRCNLYTI